MNVLETAQRLQGIPSETISHVYDYFVRLGTGVAKGFAEDVPFEPAQRASLVQSVLDYGGDDDVLDTFLIALSNDLRTPSDVVRCREFLRTLLAEHALLTGLARANALGREED